MTSSSLTKSGNATTLYIPPHRDGLLAKEFSAATITTHFASIIPGLVYKGLLRKSDFRQCHALIQRIQAEPTPVVSTSPSGKQHTFPPQKQQMKPPSANAVLAAKNVQRGLAAKVQDISGLFRKKQKVYMDRLQGHAIKNQDLLIASGAISLHGSEGMSAVEEDMAASRSQLSSQVQHQVDTQAQDRTRELADIAKNIASLADLFKDLSSLVIEQGTILDSVEYNIERTADAMEGAVKELKIAQG
ncbi:hypothetical protein FRC17_002231 [Serendipita sp. 399]|nr:hypothetical protein FRC17_002231 [Serendipita sp. 399]